MRRYIPLLIIFLLAMVSLGSIARQNISTSRPLYASDLVKIKLTPEAMDSGTLPLGLYAESMSFGINELDQLMAINGGEKLIRAHRKVNDSAWETRTGWDRWFLIKLNGKVAVEDAIKSFKANRYVEIAIPEYYAYTTAVPNDTYYANNWGHNNTAQLPVYSGSSHSGAGVGTIGFDVDAQLAWDQSQGYGSATTIIAIIDTGVDTAHPDLRLVTGYDYGDNDANPMDDSADPGHGTSCSGVAAGRANNALGVTGIAGGCSVMPLKIADSAGNLGFTAIENALTHAGDNNVDVASMSFGAEGGTAEGDSPSTDTALEYAYSHGVTLLAATANSDAATMAYPSNHNKVISVGAASPTGQRKSASSSDGEYWWGSNYGVATQDNQNAVDVMAPTILPATDITGAGNGYDTSSDYYMWFNGTSCATPYAAGVAALIISKDPSLTPAQVRTAMVSTATDMTIDGGAGWDRYTGYGMLNANAALLSLVPGMPSCTITAPLSGAVLNLNSTITVNVTATDTDGTITSVAFYIDDVLQNTDYASPWTWNWNSTGYSGGAHTIKAIATDNSSNTATSTVGITLLAPPDEGFETGNFSAFPWANASSIPWIVQSSDKFSGTYAAQSGDISDNGTTELSVVVTATGSGNISFYQKVSSEGGYDYLRFFIDGVQQGQWSGAGSWTQQTYAVNAGMHTYLWRYIKDGSVSSGSDCAWIDHIIFPPMGTYYAPPQNLTAGASHQSIKLDWAAPATGTPTGYKIYKNSSLLTTVSALTYTDTAVTNGTNYSYYLIAVYSGGESDATATVNATPNAVAPTNLLATAGNGFVNLSWTGATGREEHTEFSTSDRAISAYKIYRNSSYLTTVAGTSYTDNAVVNETTYSYYVTTVYTNPAGESGPSNTVNAMPTASVPTEVIIGSGTSSNDTTAACPVNVYYESLHGQAVYTAAELNAAGIVGPLNITQLGFNITGLPTLAMPNFIIRMGHTSATNVETWISTGLSTYWSAASYQPTVTGWNMYTLTTPFLWNGTDNILVDTAFGDIGAYTQSGTTQYSIVTNGYRYVRLDTADQTNVFTGGFVSTLRPNLKLILQPITTGPIINLDPSAFNFGSVAVGSTVVQDFTISNPGGQTLTGTITAPTGFSVSLASRDAGFVSSRVDTRNTIPFSVNAGQSQNFYLTFAPTVTGNYNSSVTIISNAENSPTHTAFITASAVNPPQITLSTDELGSSILPDATDTQSFSLGNSGGQTLDYSFTLQELRRENVSLRSASTRNIDGSTLVVNAITYDAGTTVDWTFTVTNASTDNEWLKGVYIEFPMGVTVNSATNFVGGSGGDMTPDYTSGTGIGIHWIGLDSNNWGVVHGNESAIATVNVTIPPYYPGDLVLSYQIDGDVYGTEPHILYGSIVLPQNWEPLGWLDVAPYTGSIAAGGSAPIEALFNSATLAPGQYQANILVNSNDPIHPQMSVDVILTVLNPNQAPTIELPDHFDFAKNDTLVEDFSLLVSDPDADPLTLTCVGNSNIDVEINGLMVTFSSPTGWVGIENMTFTVSDGQLQDDATVAVDSYNTPPWIGLPASFEFARNGSLVVDLAPYGGDEDGDGLAITYSGNTHIQIALDGVMATFTTTPEGWVGSELITFTVDDGYAQASDAVTITVYNNAPTITLPPAFGFDMGQQLMVDFIPYLNDANLDALTLQYSGNTNVHVSIDGLNVTFSAVADWHGMELLTFTVSDGVDQSSTTVEVFVNFVLTYLDPPVVTISRPLGLPRLQWEAVPNAITYEIYRCTTPDGMYELAFTTTDLSWEDPLESDQAFYRVKAINNPPTKK